VAGPIVRATEFLPQIKERIDPRHVDVGKAFWLISLGLFKKVVIASYLATHAADPLFGFPRQHAGVEALFGVYAYAIQIYADFSGYTDIAIGLALLLGIQFPQNFNAPYAAATLQDFWRRWHMTLSRWLRDYLYIPLGGSRRGRARTYVNIMITMLLGGLWHGAAWTFVAWGALHGIGLVVERWRGERPPAPVGPGPVDDGRDLGRGPAVMTPGAPPLEPVEPAVLVEPAAVEPVSDPLAAAPPARRPKVVTALRDEVIVAARVATAVRGAVRSGRNGAAEGPTTDPAAVPAAVPAPGPAPVPLPVRATASTGTSGFGSALAGWRDAATRSSGRGSSPRRSALGRSTPPEASATAPSGGPDGGANGSSELATSGAPGTAVDLAGPPPDPGADARGGTPTAIGVPAKLSPRARLWVGRLITFHVVCLAWVFFRATSFHNAMEVLGRIASVGSRHHPFNWKVAAVVVGALALQLGPRTLGPKLQGLYSRSSFWLQALIAAGVLTAIDLLGPAGVAPFIYFRF
ncbi:MAG: alginate O-acetyltransferase complex protein AlgI, partial [Acidimicrobiaceae bacterium]|nr:alginate O-acetyltransferase complex protein AlgI [Acidimicrobiaceae bacterium]